MHKIKLAIFWCRQNEMRLLSVKKIEKNKTHFILCVLTLKAPITTAADNSLKNFFYFSLKKIRLDISCESSVRQRIYIHHQALFSLKAKSKKTKCRLLQILYGALRANILQNPRLAALLS